jgi:chromosomal replication initiator protein
MGMPDPVIWRDMLAYLRRQHGEICRRWFEELEPLRLDGGLLEVRVQNQIQRNYLTKRCTDSFNEAAQAVTGALVAVQFTESEPARRAEPAPVPVPTIVANVANMTSVAAPVPAVAGVSQPAPPIRRSIAPPRPTAPTAQPAQASAPPTEVGAPPAPGYDDFDDQILLSPDYTFDNFVTGPGNNLAYAASVAVAEQPGKSYNPLFIHGGVGLGKTHLLQGICQTLLHRTPAARICYLSCDSFMNQFLDSVQSNQMNEFRHRYRHVDLLVIDDIHFLTNRDRTQEEFFHTFNTLYQAGKQIVLSSDSPPSEIPQLEERLVSRFNWGLVARIDKPCYETRVAIVKKKSALRGIEVPDDVACFIAGRIESNIRELEGAITKVQSQAMLRGVPIGLEIAQTALGDDGVAPAGTPQLTIQNIIDAVTHFFGVKLADLQSKRRHRSITVPRQVCMYLARKRTRYSLEEIGGYFGGRDHTTVLHAIRTTDDRMSLEAEFKQQIEHIDKQLSGPSGSATNASVANRA